MCASRRERVISAYETAEVDPVFGVGKVDAARDMHLVPALILCPLIDVVMLHRAPPRSVVPVSPVIPVAKAGRKTLQKKSALAKKEVLIKWLQRSRRSAAKGWTSGNGNGAGMGVQQRSDSCVPCGSQESQVKHQESSATT